MISLSRVFIRLVLLCAAVHAARNCAGELPDSIKAFFQPPPEFANDFGTFRSPLKFADGREAKTPEEWAQRRTEIRDAWFRIIGPWPKLIEAPNVEVLSTAPNGELTQQRLRIEVAPGQNTEGWLLLPKGTGPFPAVVVVFYEPDTSIGAGKNPGGKRDFALQLSRQGFVTLSIGTPAGDAWKPGLGDLQCQPLAYYAYVAANCHTILARRKDVDAQRIGIMGHSYGGKWALFAAALYDKFAACVVSDPGIVWDEKRGNVNYWEPWYLGRDPNITRKPGLITATNPRTGAYKVLVEEGRDLVELEALLAPRPFLVSGGSEDGLSRWPALNHLIAVNKVCGAEQRVALTTRSGHPPTDESNAVIYAFFKTFLSR